MHKAWLLVYFLVTSIWLLHASGLSSGGGAPGGPSDRQPPSGGTATGSMWASLMGTSLDRALTSAAPPGTASLLGDLTRSTDTDRSGGW